MAAASISPAPVAAAIWLAGAIACASDEYRPFIDEVRAGGAFSSNQGQVSDFVHLEVLLSAPFIGPAYAPAWLLSPRPLLGATISTQGRTSELLAGLTWSAPLPAPFLLELSLGGAVHDQPLFVQYPDRPELSTRFLFRESLAAGYQITPQWRVLAFAEHDSNGNLGSPNYGVNHFGLELGRKFGELSGESAAPSPPASPFRWAGPYIGLSTGLANGTHSVTVTAPPGTGVTLAPAPSGSIIIGGQVGYNWPIGELVTGLEADYSAQNLGTGIWTPAYYPFTAASESLATARVRAGMIISEISQLKSLLIYATGGAAFAGLATNYCLPSPSCFQPGPGGSWTNQTQFKDGWTAGGGIELPLAANVTTKLEYLYADFGEAAFQHATALYVIRATEELLRAGVSFRFAAN